MSRPQKSLQRPSTSQPVSLPVSQPASSTPPSMITTQSAIYMLHQKIKTLEESLKESIKQIETKMGEQDSYVSDNIPDLDLINNAFRDVNKRILEFEAMDARIATLEKAMNIDPPAGKKKRGGTIKLQDQPESVGVSFSS